MGLRPTRIHLLAAGAAFAIAGAAHAGLTGWINEFHYDNVSTDSGEFVEVALLSGADANNFNVTLYNGSNGSVYNTLNIGAEFSVGDTADGYTLYFLTLPVNGIQNGPPDGIALDQGGSLMEFLSYEGDFAGVGGAADGVTSTDIGVTQGSGTPVGSSVGLTGGPIGSFTWTNFDAALAGGTGATPGSLNHGQTLIPAPGVLALLGVAGLAGRRRRRPA